MVDEVLNDEPSTAELHRLIGRLEKAVDGVSRKVDSLDGKFISREVFAVEKEALHASIADNRRHTEAEVRLVNSTVDAIRGDLIDFRRATTRWVTLAAGAITSVLGSLIIVFHH